MKRTRPSGLPTPLLEVNKGEGGLQAVSAGMSFGGTVSGEGLGSSHLGFHWIPPHCAGHPEVQGGKGWGRRNLSCLDALYSIWYFENTLHLPVSKSRWDSNKFSQYYYDPGLLMWRVRSDGFAQGLQFLWSRHAASDHFLCSRGLSRVRGKQTLSRFLSWARPSRSQTLWTKGESLPL